MGFGNIFQNKFVEFFDNYKGQGFNEFLPSFDCALESANELDNSKILRDLACPARFERATYALEALKMS